MLNRRGHVVRFNEPLLPPGIAPRKKVLGSIRLTFNPHGRFLCSLEPISRPPLYGTRPLPHLGIVPVAHALTSLLP